MVGDVDDDACANWVTRRACHIASLLVDARIETARCHTSVVPRHQVDGVLPACGSGIVEVLESAIDGDVWHKRSVDESASRFYRAVLLHHHAVSEGDVVLLCHDAHIVIIAMDSEVLEAGVGIDHARSGTQQELAIADIAILPCDDGWLVFLEIVRIIILILFVGEDIEDILVIVAHDDNDVVANLR